LDGRDTGTSGKVRFIVRDLPLEFHSAARPAAEVAHCAGEQGKFWPILCCSLFEGRAFTDPSAVTIRLDATDGLAFDVKSSLGLIS